MHTGGAGARTAMLVGASGCDTLFVAPKAATGLDVAVAKAPMTGAGLAQRDTIDDALGLSEVQLSPSVPCAALAVQQVDVAACGLR